MNQSRAQTVLATPEVKSARLRPLLAIEIDAEAAKEE
jgi:hypothetical protein